MSTLAIPTEYGREWNARAAAGEAVSPIVEMRFGDGTRVPDGSETSLENEVHKTTFANQGISSDGLSAFFDGPLPKGVGGFVIREVGLFTADGNMVAVGTRAPGLPIIEIDDFTYRFEVFFDRLEALTVELDPIHGLTEDRLPDVLPWASEAEFADAGTTGRIAEVAQIHSLIDDKIDAIPEFQDTNTWRPVATSQEVKTGVTDNSNARNDVSLTPKTAGEAFLPRRVDGQSDSENNVDVLLYPENTFFSRHDAGHTGALEIALSKAATGLAANMTVKLRVQAIVPRHSCTYELSGQFKKNDGEWQYLQATCTMPEGQLPVRYTYDGDAEQAYIYVGDLDTNWSHVVAVVESVTLGLTNTEHEAFNTAFTLDLVDAFKGEVQHTQAQPELFPWASETEFADSETTGRVAEVAQIHSLIDDKIDAIPEYQDVNTWRPVATSAEVKTGVTDNSNARDDVSLTPKTAGQHFLPRRVDGVVQGEQHMDVLLYPEQSFLSRLTPNVTGAVEIKIPREIALLSVVFSMDLKLQSVTPQHFAKYTITGQFHDDDKRWYHNTAVCSIPEDQLPVRYTYDDATGDAYIYIGNLDTQWGYFCAIIEQVLLTIGDVDYQPFDDAFTLDVVDQFKGELNQQVLPIPVLTDWPNYQAFTYTGDDQTFTIPQDASFIRMTAIGGSSSYSTWASPGGVAQAIFRVQSSEQFSLSLLQPGDELAVMVGNVGGRQLGPVSSYNGVYGFGGAARTAVTNHAAGRGGGASLVAKKSDLVGSKISNADRNAVLVVGGGGGGVSNEGPSSTHNHGLNGGSATAGGNIGSMFGLGVGTGDVSGFGTHFGAGGGGYEGGGIVNNRTTGRANGDMGRGGTSFVHPDTILSEFQSFPDGTTDGSREIIDNNPNANALTTLGKLANPGGVLIEWIV